MPRPSVHDPITKSYAIDQIEDIEHLRRVAHRMWEAFFAAHSQTAHVIGVLLGYNDCAECQVNLRRDPGAVEDNGCEQWRAWQAKVYDGFGSV